MINSNELLFVVDEDNNPIDPETRAEVHEKGLWHRVVHVWVVNSEGMILCQKRSIMKDLAPGNLESFFGGHMEAGIEPEVVVEKEINEELGIDVKTEDVQFYKINKAGTVNEFQYIYIYFWDGKLSELKLEEDEVDGVDLYEINDLEEIFSREDEDWTILGSELDVLNFIKRTMSSGRES